MTTRAWHGIRRNRNSLFTLLLFSGGAAGLHGQSSLVAGAHKEIPLAEIIEGMSRSEAAQSRDLKHYTSIRTYHLENRRFKTTADMTVRLTYRYPGRKEFEVLSESGPGTLRDRVLLRMVESEVEASRDDLRRLNQLTTANYDFRFLRLDRDEGRPVFVLDAEPKTKSKYLIKGEVWVDAADFGVSRVIGRPAKSPSFLIRGPRLVYRYARFGSFWLPVATDSEADAILFGHTEVKIRYRDYRINSEHTGGSSTR
jgi:hypothetical protein